MKRAVILLVTVAIFDHVRPQATPNTGCGSNPADIEFLLDTSGSVTQTNFDKIKDFVRQFTQGFEIGPNAVQFGVATFDTHPKNQFWMNEHTTNASLLTAIDAITYSAGSTHTDEALQFVRQNAFTTAHGDRDRVTNILIVVTDGMSNNKQATLAQAAELHKTNINVFAVGVGSNLDHAELEAIASKPANVFTVTNFDALESIQAELQRTACEVNGNWSPWGFFSPCSSSCGGGTQYRERTCTDPAPANGGQDCHGSAHESRTCNTEPCTLPPTTTNPVPIIPAVTIGGCGLQPADIVFIVDASGSVGQGNFATTLDFVKSMVSGFTIGPNDFQIGMITFDSKPYLQFHLNRYNNQADVLSAISRANYTQGGTNTHLALKYAADTSFTQANGARDNAAKIAIVITDGRSQDSAATAQEAQHLRDKGVTVFSIGVGTGPQESELRAMASDPDSDHVFIVTNFDALSLIKSSLQQRACEVKPTVVAATSVPQNASCGGKADIVFLLDESGSVTQPNFDKMLSFVKDVTNNFNIGPDDVQIGVDTFSSEFTTEFTLGQFTNKQQILNAVNTIRYDGGSTLTGPAITSMINSFSTAAGHRAGVPKVAIIVTDGLSNNPSATAAAAQTARDSGIHMLAIGVGNAVSDTELNAIASDPDSQNVYRAATFDSLASLQGLLAAKACEQFQQIPQQLTCGPQADIVFNLDKSGSVGAANFKILLSFVSSMARDFDVGQGRIRIGVETFSTRPSTEFHLNRYNDKQQLLDAINTIPYDGGATNTGDALRFMKDIMFNAANGDRPGVPNIGIIITDGQSNSPDQTRDQAQQVRNAGITLFSVGIGRGVSIPELNAMATDPDSTHVFTVDDFSKLSQIKALFQQQTCDAIPASLPPLTQTTAPSSQVVTDPCQDSNTNCKSYDPSVCLSFAPWAHDNCQRYCGFCTTAIPTIPPPCEDTLTNCPSYPLDSCINYQPWALDNCRKYCGYCMGSTVGIGYFNKCYYNGNSYSQGEKWSDGCSYDCECIDASAGKYQCFNKCPIYYNLPPQCTLVQQQGECCLQAVCNFDARYQINSGQNVADLNGNKVCVYNGEKYYQSQTWSVGCDLDCICDDAGVGLWACQSKCATYGPLPSSCKLVRPPGECCAKPECEFNTQIGAFSGIGQSSGPGGHTDMSSTPVPCVDVLPDCTSYDPTSCTTEAYRPWALANCKKTCGLCNIPGSDDRCVYNGLAYRQGQTWSDECDKQCICEDATYGYYRCDTLCPDYYNLPPGCTLETVVGICCKALKCISGTIVGSQLVPNTIGAYPIPFLSPTAAPGLRPGGTLAPGQTIPPYLTPVPGQTLAPGIVPGNTLAPGVTVPLNLTPAPGQTYAPMTTNPYTTPAPLIPGHTLAPGQTIPPYITPSPGNTFGPGIIPGQTLAPGATVPSYLTPGPGQIYASNTNSPPLANSLYAVPQKLSGCIYKSNLYQQGQRWTDGCFFTCVCEDGNTGRFRCSPKCLQFQNLDTRCTLQDDPNDPCCKTPVCPVLPSSQIITVIPNYGQSFTSYSPAAYPTSLSGIVPVPTAVSSTTSSSVTGTKQGCLFNNQLYQQGSTWRQGCLYNCECVDGQTGFYRCTDVCPNYQSLPAQCHLIPDPNNACCQTYTCDFTQTTPSPSINFVGVATPATGVDYCVYNGRYYRQGEEWVDGCSLRCRCEDARNRFYQCTTRCATYSNVPLGCTLMPDPKDPQCCKIPECDSATDLGGILSGNSAPLGFIGTFSGTGRPQSVNLLASSGYRNACIYQGQIYSQGQTWQDGCDFDCECTDAATGIYTCTDRCQRYAAIPIGCNLVQNLYDNCCLKAECAPPASSACHDVKDNCYMYGDYACRSPFEEWARDNCAAFCGFCGTRTTVNPVNCVDRLPNCDAYGMDGCVGQYQAWAQYNCPRFCGYCGGSWPITTASSILVVGSSQSTQAGTGTGQCQDVLPNCNEYGQSACVDPYRSWALANCAHYCSLCGADSTGSIIHQATSAPGSIVTGYNLGCYYNGQVYNHGQEWQDGCDYNCTCINGQTGNYRCTARCLTYSSLPQGCHLETVPNDCCTVPVCDGSTDIQMGNLNSCIYKNQVHPANSTWNDGCSYTCTCVDGTSGQYVCSARCVQWLLPAACHLISPADGKCCPIPSCPSGYTINYPPGYMEQ